MENVLNIENLKYKDVLKNITFSLKEKTFNILVSPNNNMVETFIKCIRGLLKYEGIVNVNNRDIGYFLDKNIYFESSVFDSLYELLINLDYLDIDAKEVIYKFCKKLNATNILYKKVNELKSYEKTLVTLIHSLIYKPKLLIINNDLEIFDDKKKNMILKLIKKEKIAVFFITTNPNYFQYADTLFVLNDGKISELENIEKEEKRLTKNNSKLPFNIEISNKFIAYELIDSYEDSLELLVDKIWK